MAARAMWKGNLVFGDASIAVKLYAAVQDRAVHFRLLHAADETPVRQHLVNPTTGAEVPSGRIRKGYEVERGRFVLLSEKELDGLAPPPSRDVVIERFVPADAVAHEWYDRPYWCGPDGDAGTYHALAAALEKTGRAGVARWVMRGREYTALLRPEAERLMLVTLYHATEVVPATALEPPGGRPLDRKELALAEQLVGALESRFDPGRYHDEHRARVRELIEKKARGERIRAPRVAPKKPPASLARALEASLARTRKAEAHG